MVSTADILTAYDSQLRLLVPRRVPAGHEYQLRGRLLRVTGQLDLERIAAMKSAVWGTDCGWVAADLQHRLAKDPENLVVLMAEAAGTVVSAAWLEINPDTDFAGLWGGSTLPAWRGRGIYKALVAVRAQVAADRGAKYLQLDGSADSEPILRRLGFRAITTTTPFVWTPPGSGRSRAT